MTVMGKWKRWWIPSLAVVCGFLLVVWRFGLFSGPESGREVIRILSDGFVIPGVLAAGVGAVSWASDMGTFDMLGYGMKAFFSLFTRNGIKKLPKSYFDYKEEKRSHPHKWLWETLIVGLAFVLVGVILMLVFSGMKA